MTFFLFAVALPPHTYPFLSPQPDFALSTAYGLSAKSQPASDPNIPAVTAVSDLGFGGRTYNTSPGASTPTGGATIRRESDPAIMAANGTVKPSPTAFVGASGPGGASTTGGSGRSATATATGAASRGGSTMNVLAGHAILAGGILTLMLSL